MSHLIIITESFAKAKTAMTSPVVGKVNVWHTLAAVAIVSFFVGVWIS